MSVISMTAWEEAGWGVDVSVISMTAWEEPDEDGGSECGVSGTEPPLPAVAGAEASIVSED